MGNINYHALFETIKELKYIKDNRKKYIKQLDRKIKECNGTGNTELLQCLISEQRHMFDEISTVNKIMEDVYMLTEWNIKELK